MTISAAPRADNYLGKLYFYNSKAEDTQEKTLLKNSKLKDDVTGKKNSKLKDYIVIGKKNSKLKDVVTGKKRHFMFLWPYRDATAI